MFVNKRDTLRKAYGIERKNVESLFRNQRFALPMPAMGELLYKIREKQPDDYRDSIDNLFKLVDSGFIEVRFISNASKVYDMAKKIVEMKCDSRDRISPMDALIFSTAVADQDCMAFYTADVKLISASQTHGLVDEFREELGYEPMNVADISDIMK